MSELAYVDTNVYLDYIFQRKDRFRDLGQFAFEFFQKTIECNYTIVISDWVIEELQSKVDWKQIEPLIQWLEEKEKITKIVASKDNTQEARKYSHWQDALHEILADKAGAKIVVTRNLADFSRIRKSIQAKLPESL